MPNPGPIYADCFETTGELRSKKRTYEAIKAAVLEAGRFSVFEATASAKDARMFERLKTDPEVELYDLEFPWHGVRRKGAESAEKG